MALLFPYELVPTNIPNFTSNVFQVDISRSISGLETRVLLSDNTTDGVLNLRYDPLEFYDILYDFFTLTSGTHIPFEIPADHALWEMLPCRQRDRYNPLWRFFDQQLRFDRIGGCLYTVEINIINVLA